MLQSKTSSYSAGFLRKLDDESEREPELKVEGGAGANLNSDDKLPTLRKFIKTLAELPVVQSYFKNSCLVSDYSKVT